IVNSDECFGEAHTFEIEAFRDVASVEWDFGDGTTSSQLNPTHTFTTVGLQKVKATIIGRNNYPVTLYRDVYVYPLPELDPATVMKQCDAENDGIGLFNLNNIDDKIENQDLDYTFTFYR